MAVTFSLLQVAVLQGNMREMKHTVMKPGPHLLFGPGDKKHG